MSTDDSQNIEVNTAPEKGQEERRIERILETRQLVIENRADVRSALHARKLSAYQARTLYRDILESFLLTIEPPLSNADHELWYHDEIYSWELCNRYGIAENIAQSDKTAPHLRKQSNETITHTIAGLSGILDANSPIRVERQIWQYDNRARRCSYITTTEKHQIPFRGLDKIFRETSTALADAGLDLDLEDVDNVAEYDYSDLI